MSPQALSKFPKSNSNNDAAVAEIRAKEEGAPEDGQDVKGRSDVPVPEVHEDSRGPRVGRRPVLPTKADFDEHFSLHLNY